MATAIAYQPLNMQMTTKWYGAVTVATPTTLQIWDPITGVTGTYSGVGLTYNPMTGAVTGGTITGYIETDGFGATTGAVTGANVNAVTFFGASTAQAMYALALSGNDLMTGSAGADVLLGYSGNDGINGGAGNDRLIGGAGNDVLNGGLGGDVLTGDAGNDTYVVDNALDVVTETLNSGTDTVKSTVSYTLGANLENLTLLGLGVINANGNALNNVIYGNSAANVLNGGVGADTLAGGFGNDIYVVDSALDVVTEAFLAGTDTVRSSVTYTLGYELENLTLLGAAAINGTGNALANTLIGNAVSNTLNGGAGNDLLNGGLGADTLIGGMGNDSYIVDNALDVVTEALNSGIDTVQSSITYTLGANVENLTLSGVLAINGTGNALNNSIMGNAAANTLQGGAGNDILNGGLGADTMIGGLGNDTYVVDNALDVVTELAGQGVDTVQSSVSFVLGTDLENLTLTGVAAINGTGSAVANILTGNAAANILDGGAGADTLTGGLGNDTFAFSAALDGSIDTIADFTVGDIIQLGVSGLGGSSIFAGLLGTVGNGTGNLAGAEFVSGAGAVANAASAQILYDTTTGVLSFDADGTGANAAVAFAQLTGIPALATTDFVLA